MEDAQQTFPGFEDAVLPKAQADAVAALHEGLPNKTTCTVPEAAAFLGAIVSGLLAHLAERWTSYPRISLTVPSIVIMVPGLYLYRAMYYMCVFDTASMLSWFVRAVLIVAFLPVGLGIARTLTDPRWRKTS